jgi:hypothetical protein
MTDDAPNPLEAAFVAARNADARESRIASRPAHLGPYVGAGRGFTPRAITAKRPAAEQTGLEIGPRVLGDLANQPVWVGWRRETRKGRSTKVPYNPRTGRRAASDDPSTWATLEQARSWVATDHGNGVGVMLGQLDGGMFLCGVDLDSCRNPASGDFAPWAQEIVDRFVTYTEVSPSGTGAKLFFTVAKADVVAVEAVFGSEHGRTFKNGGGDHPPAIEIYCRLRYFTVTGESCGPTDDLRRVGLSDQQWLIREVGPKFASRKGNGRDDSRSAKAWRAGTALKASGASYEVMRGVLLRHQNSGVADWAQTKGLADNEREMRRIYDKADGDGPAAQLEDFVAYMQSHDYVYMPAGDFWPAARVDARLPPVLLFDKNGKPMIDEKTGAQKEMRASAWLAKHAPVEQMTWAPGLPELVRDKLIGDGGWIDRKGVTVLNLYRPPTIELGDATKAEPWLAHLKKIYPDEAGHIILWLAHRVQRPHEKVNHGIVLGGLQGIGKDTLLEPVKHAVGPWNFAEVSPQQMLGRFNGFVKSVVLRISEAKDMGEFDRFKFYAHMKVYLASPPDVLRVDEKNLREHSVFNVCGVVMTTNHKTDGIFLPSDDRRHFVAWSEATKDDFSESYWDGLWGWYESEGFGHVAAYLAELDLSRFNPKAPPPKTPAFWAIVDANRAPEDAELADVLDELDQPHAVTLAELQLKAKGDLYEWLCDRKNRRTPSPTASSSAATSQCATTPPRMGSSRSKAAAKSSTRRPAFPSRIALGRPTT